MFRSKSLVAVVFGGALLALPAFSQDESAQYKSEASVSAFGSFTKSTNDNSIPQSATNTGGVLASYRYFFTQHQGVEANYGYSLNTQNYGLATGNTGVNSYSHELTAAYVLRLNPIKRVTPFVLAGAGALVFDPKDFAGANSQARAAFVYGGGADFNISKRVYFRAGYRGLVYNSPNFDVSTLNVDRLSHRAEPFGGLGFRF